MSITYKMCKTLIEKKRYEKDAMLEKLDVFLLANRITKEEYEELVGMLQ